MLKAWLVSSLIMGIMLLPVAQNWDNPQRLKKCINSFLYVGLGSFVLLLVLALMT
ncbi:MAG TPA: hypothetical protein GX691_01625 [Clostridia bacterium]|nr:hypothetical protein [Clostridia bacterium]